MTRFSDLYDDIVEIILGKLPLLIRFRLQRVNKISKNACGFSPCQVVHTFNIYHPGYINQFSISTKN